MNNFLTNRFITLRWPLKDLSERVKATRSEGIMNAQAAAKRFPIRGLRYWWIRHALLDEINTTGTQLSIIADLGCNRGHIKRFSGDIPNARWIGLDKDIEKTALSESGYSEFCQCDFDNPLPLVDHSVDIVVFSHVIEHLLRPGFAVAEISRILKPGGIVIAGSPVAPSPIAQLREWQLRRYLRTGRSKLGNHINSFSPGRWRRLLHGNELYIEKLTGTFLARWSGNPLENQAWWVRMNQLWGALFPGLGGEIYLTARKPRS